MIIEGYAVKVKVHIILKAGVLDPQGIAVKNALHSLGFLDVMDVRQGKYIELEIDENDTKKAEQKVGEMCDQLLANTVIEDYQVQHVE